MEYKINNFNFADIPFKDIQSLTNYFETTVLQQKIKNLLLGPNVINIKYPNKTTNQIEENKKIINTICRLILSNFLLKPEQAFVLQSTSNLSSKSYMKKIFKELEFLITQKIQINNKQEIYNCIFFYDFLSLFTCVKDEFFDEIPLCDYFIQLYYGRENGLKCADFEVLQMNSEFICSRLSPFNQTQLNSNNVHCFYMMMYNLPVSDLMEYLSCDKTKDFFRVFDSLVDNEDCVRRYIFISRFKILKNIPQYAELAKSKSNVEMIRKEFEYYKLCYKRYQSVKEYLRFGDDTEKHLFRTFCGILLLSEFDLLEDPLGVAIINRLSLTTGEVSFSEIYTLIKSIVFADLRYSGKEKLHMKKISDNESILSKAAINLGMSEEKIVFTLVTEFVSTNSLIVKLNKDSISNAKVKLISTVYYLFIDQIKLIFQNYKDENVSTSTSGNKFNFLISRSNLVYKQGFIFSTPVESNDNFMNTQILNDPEVFVVRNNVREAMIGNYIQELKNFLILINALSITSMVKEFSWPVIQYNESFISKLMNENYGYNALLLLYEHPNFGLLRLLDKEPKAHEKEDSILALFKSNFANQFQREGVVELLDLGGSYLGKGRTYLQVKHTFGTFIYDLTECFVGKRSATTLSLLKEESLWKFLDYHPSMNEQTHKEISYKAYQRIKSKMVYVNMLIKVNKFSIISMFEDLKLNNIYYFYKNFFNYIISIKDIRENIIKNPKMKISNYLHKDDSTLFKAISKKIRISSLDFYYENGYIYAKNSFNRVMDYNKNISNLMFKYNHKMFYYLIVKKVSVSDFSYFRFAISAVRAYVRLTQILNEKKVFRIVRNLLTDVIVDNYNIVDPTKDISKMNFEIVSKLDKLPEILFDFKKETLSKILPKLHSNLAQLKKIWKDYVTDIIYLEMNKGNFSNPTSTEMLIEERSLNFQILLFLFSKKYNFVNFEHLKKFGVLLSEFTKSISGEVILMLTQLYIEFKEFWEERDFQIENRENITFEKLITKRVSIVQEQRQRLSLENTGQASIPMKAPVVLNKDPKSSIAPVILGIEDNFSNFSFITAKKTSKKLEEAVLGTKIDYMLEPSFKNNDINVKEILLTSESGDERNKNNTEISKMVYSKARNANNRKFEKFINNRSDNRHALDIQAVDNLQKEKKNEKEKGNDTPQDESSSSNLFLSFKPISTEGETIKNNTKISNDNSTSFQNEEKKNAPKEEKPYTNFPVNNTTSSKKTYSPSDKLASWEQSSKPKINSDVMMNLIPPDFKANDNTPKFCPEKQESKEKDNPKSRQEKHIIAENLLLSSIHSSSESEKLMDKKKAIEGTDKQLLALSPEDIHSIHLYSSGTKQQMTYLEQYKEENIDDYEDTVLQFGFFSSRNTNMKRVRSFHINGRRLSQELKMRLEEQRISKSLPKCVNNPIQKKDSDPEKEKEKENDHNEQSQVYQKKKVGNVIKPQTKRCPEKEDNLMHDIPQTRSRKDIHRNPQEDTTTNQEGLLVSQKKYFSEKTKNNPSQFLNLTSLKELDSNLELLKKELTSLEIMEAITEQTSLLCFKNDTLNDDIDIFTITKKVNEEFYREIEAGLRTAESLISKNPNDII